MAKYTKDKRELITVRLGDGYMLKISNRAKIVKCTRSEIVRRAIRKFLGL